mgnify:CR=1 FL=1
MTTIDFKAEVEKRREEMMADLFSLLEINSERDDSQADATHPYGPGPVKALEKFLEIAERDGYETTNVDTSPLDKGKKSSGSLPTWMWYLLVVAGTQILTNLRLSMASSMRVVHQMTRGLQ